MKLRGDWESNTGPGESDEGASLPNSAEREEEWRSGTGRATEAGNKSRGIKVLGQLSFARSRGDTEAVARGERVKGLGDENTGSLIGKAPVSGEGRRQSGKDQAGRGKGTMEIETP